MHRLVASAALAAVSLLELVHGHKCIHDDYIRRQPVVLAYNQSYELDDVSYGGSGRRAQAVACTDFASCTASYQPIRIVTDFSYLSSSGTSMTTAKRDFIQNTLAPAVAQRWGTILSVARVSGNLKAARDCNTAWNSNPPKCAELAAETQCGFSNGGADEDVKIVFSSDQLGQQTYYPVSASVPVTASGGLGVPDADFVMFVTAKQTSDCGDGTLAYATSCQRDQYDRPTWGRVNFCPDRIDPSAGAWDAQLGTALHEYAHTLGFSSDSWPLFRNWDAARSPKTARDPSSYWNVPDTAHKTSTYSCGGSSEWSYFADQSTTVAYFAERGATQCTPTYAGAHTDLCVAKHVGPRSVTAAREHFDCPTLNGAELENHLTTACSFQGSHWEQRIFNGELMGSYLQRTAYISAVTLALFEDSGWYKADYSKADGFKKGLDWGFKQGCAFASGKCLTGSPLAGTGSPPHFFATDGDRCTLDRAGFGPTVITSGQSIPAMYQYLSATGTGGKQSHDFCPFTEAYGNRICKTATPYTYMDKFGEAFGADTACFEKSLKMSGWGPVPSVGCMKYQCSGGPGGYAVTISAAPGKNTTCFTDQEGMSKTIAGFDGSVTCPDPEALCGQPLVMIPSYAGGNYTYTPPVETTVKVYATLLIAGLSKATADAAGSDFTSAVRSALATLLGVPAARVTVSTTSRVQYTARLLAGSSFTTQVFHTARMLQNAGSSLAVDFSVDTTSAASSTVVSTIRSTLVPGSAGYSSYSSARAAMVNQIAAGAAVSPGSLSVSVNPTSISTVAPQSTSGPLAAAMLAVIIVVVVIGVCFVACCLAWMCCCRSRLIRPILTAAKVQPVQLPMAATAGMAQPQGYGPASTAQPYGYGQFGMAQPQPQGYGPAGMAQPYGYGQAGYPAGGQVPYYPQAVPQGQYYPGPQPQGQWAQGQEYGAYGK